MNQDKEKHSWFQGMLENTYPSLVEVLEKRREDYNYVRQLVEKFVPKERENYHLARSIVMDVHIQLERTISLFICLLLGFGGTQFGLHKKPMKEMLNPLSKIMFSRRLELLEALQVFSDETIKILWQVNNLRNAFAHGYDTNGTHYDYDNMSIFTREGINKLVGDHKRVADELSNKFKTFRQRKT